MDVNSQRVEMITGKSIEETTEKLNSFLKLCEEKQAGVQDIEYYALQDRESEDKHSYLVRYDRYSKHEIEAYLEVKSVNKIAEAWKNKA